MSQQDSHIPPCPELPKDLDQTAPWDTSNTPNPEMYEKSAQNLLSHLKSFDKKALKKTETCIKTEDGKILQETHDSCGNYATKVTNKDQYGFVPDMCLDLQVGEIRDNLIMGSQDIAADREILKKYNVTHILNLANLVKNYFSDSIKYMNIIINDMPTEDVLQHFQKAFAFVDSGRQCGSVFIHCNAGISRASTFTIGYLMYSEKMPLSEAYSDVKSKRPAIQPNVGFMKQLESYNNILGLLPRLCEGTTN
ncbi:dual specificity protein phosphatase 19-like [Dreissena polymorpha]|uniref:Uncharacterized protein n=1 Tax=Dreissena polymorpha TaxID=45954 RepID=A0A9D4HI79_DREPO|nr:dual specificity protein phosphatase 19-like [Dreissena polymorpha]KAH3720095.1 hypothetical protein DPMN_062988 [Dreissena polymorpha]